jgi:hypothetical protein
MNQTLFEPTHASDESSATQSPSKSSQPKSSDSFKAADKKTKKSKSSTETPAETPEEKEKRKRERKDKSSTETPEEKVKRKMERKDKKQRKKEKKERKEKESKSKDSTETSEEKAQRRQEKKDKKEKESKSKDSTETPEEKAQRRKERKENKKDKKNKRDSQIQKKDDKAQKLDIAEKLQCRSLGSENVTQATDVDSDWSDDGSMQFDILVKTLRRRLEEVESENRQLNEKNIAMQALEIQLIRAEEQLEHAAKEKNDFSHRIYALEQALADQKTELDNTPVTMKPITFEAGPIGMLLGTTINDQACRVDGFVDGGPDDPSQARKSGKIQMGDVIVSVNGIVPDSYEDAIDLLKEGGTREIVFRSGTQDDDYDDDYLSTDGIDDGLIISDEKNDKKLAYHEELAVVQEQLNQLRHERDMAIDRASELTIQSGNCKAKLSESYERVAECKVVIEQLRASLLDHSTQQSSSASVCSVPKKMDLRSGTLSIGLKKLGSLWGNRNKNGDKMVMSTYDDDCMLDLTEDNTSVASEEEGWDLEQIDIPHNPSWEFVENLNCSTAHVTS